MPIIEKTIRFAAITFAVLFIGLSLFGIFGAWFVDRKATDVALKGFGLIEIGVGVVDAGVSRVDDLIATSRTEVRQASETIAQLRGTLRALVAEQKSDIAPETVAALKGITQRIDTRLGEVQANIDGVQADITALQVRLDTRKSRLLFVFNLVALLSTLMLARIIYTQVVVIQHHWARVRPPAAKPATGDDEPAPTVD
jgi:hypothetical protein